MNLPNKITLTRIILIPFIMFFYLMPWPAGKIVAIVLFCLGILTDFLDGKIARKYNLVSTLGIFLDTIADKMLVLVCMILVVSDGTIMSPLGVIAFSIILIRELAVSALRQLGAQKNIVICADMLGKYKATFQFLFVVFFMLYSYLLGLPNLSYTVDLVVQIICYSLLGVAVLLTIISGVHYLIKNKGVFIDENKSNSDVV